MTPLFPTAVAVTLLPLTPNVLFVTEPFRPPTPTLLLAPKWTAEAVAVMSAVFDW